MKRLFGTLDGREIYAVDLKSNNISCTVITLGCILQSLYVPDSGGRAENVVLGYDSPGEYAASVGHFGEVVGRCCNRIGDSRFTLDGVEYTLPANDGRNHLHGGPLGFGERIWDIADCDDNKAVFTLDSCDGDMGYPGNVHVQCTYALSDDGNL